MSRSTKPDQISGLEERQDALNAEAQESAAKYGLYRRFIAVLREARPELASIVQESEAKEQKKSIVKGSWSTLVGTAAEAAVVEKADSGPAPKKRNVTPESGSGGFTFSFG